jgi:hypothetical protein
MNFTPNATTVASITTPAPTSEGLAVGAIAGIVIGGLFFLTLIWCMTYFFRMYFHYTAKPGTASESLFAVDERGCCNQMCIAINTPALQCCCPWITNAVIESNPLHANAIHVNATGGGNAATSMEFPGDWCCDLQRCDEHRSLLTPPYRGGEMIY